MWVAVFENLAQIISLNVRFLTKKSKLMKKKFSPSQEFHDNVPSGDVNFSFDNPAITSQPRLFCWRSETDNKFQFLLTKIFFFSSKCFFRHVECRFGNRCKKFSYKKQISPQSGEMMTTLFFSANLLNNSSGQLESSFENTTGSILQTAQIWWKNFSEPIFFLKNSPLDTQTLLLTTLPRKVLQWAETYLLNVRKR